jgi:putative rhamnosyltransferase
MTNIQALGIVRFSYASIGGYQIEHATVEERLDFLFDPVRIEERFALFEHVMLPSIRAQTDPDFTLVIITSQAIPEPYLTRLYELVDGMPQVAVVLKEPRQHRKAIRQATRPYIDPDCDVVAQFRLDDDDAVAVDFVERAKAAFVNCADQYKQAGKCALDFTRGILLQVGDNKCFAFQKQFKQLSLVVYLPPDHPKTTIHYPHHRISEFMPVISDTTPDMYVRSLNSFNDSPQARAKPVPDLSTPKEVVEVLQNRFHISTADLAKATRF